MNALSEMHDVQPYEYSVSLRIRHPSADPSEISRELQMQPRRMWKAGDARTTPVGTPLSGTYAETYWYTKLCSVVSAADEPLDSALARFLDALRGHEQFLLRMRREGGGAEFYVGVNGPGSFGFEFHPTLLTDFASMGVALSLEVFPVPQNA